MIDNPFLAGKLYREDELGEAAVQRANWRYVAFGALGLSGLLILLLFYTVSLPRKVPVPIEVNTCSGDVRIVQEDWRRYVPPETAYTTLLRETLTTLRTITTDKDDMRQHHRLARARMTLQGKQLYAQYEKERKPFAQKEPVQVEILSSLHDTGLTWDVRWRETTYSHKVDIEHWRGKFTFVKGVPQTDEERYATPLGLFLEHWSWSKE